MKKMMMTALTGAMLAVSAMGLNAQLISFGLGGTQSTDIWNNLGSATVSGYPGYPGSAPWPSPIASQSGGGDASLNKTAGAAYPGNSGNYIYFGGFSTVPNTFGGTLEASDATAVGGIQTVVAQVYATYASEYTFYDNVYPTLTYQTNLGGTETLASDYVSFINAVYTGETMGIPSYLVDYGFQWDLSDVDLDPGEFIESFDITWSNVQHTELHGVQIDQSTTTYNSSVLPASVPEPGTASLVLLAGGLLLARRRKA